MSALLALPTAASATLPSPALTWSAAVRTLGVAATTNDGKVISDFENAPVRYIPLAAELFAPKIRPSEMALCRLLLKSKPYLNPPSREFAETSYAAVA